MSCAEEELIDDFEFVLDKFDSAGVKLTLTHNTIGLVPTFEGYSVNELFAAIWNYIRALALPDDDATPNECFEIDDDLRAHLNSAATRIVAAECSPDEDTQQYFTPVFFLEAFYQYLIHRLGLHCSDRARLALEQACESGQYATQAGQTPVFVQETPNEPDEHTVLTALQQRITLNPGESLLFHGCTQLDAAAVLSGGMGIRYEYYATQRVFPELGNGFYLNPNLTGERGAYAHAYNRAFAAHEDSFVVLVYKRIRLPSEQELRDQDWTNVVTHCWEEHGRPPEPFNRCDALEGQMLKKSRQGAVPIADSWQYVVRSQSAFQVYDSQICGVFVFRGV